MRFCIFVAALALALGPQAFAQNSKIRVIAFGAHPDDA